MEQSFDISVYTNNLIRDIKPNVNSKKIVVKFSDIDHDVLVSDVPKLIHEILLNTSSSSNKYINLEVLAKGIYKYNCENPITYFVLLDCKRKDLDFGYLIEELEEIGYLDIAAVVACNYFGFGMDIPFPIIYSYQYDKIQKLFDTHMDSYKISICPSGVKPEDSDTIWLKESVDNVDKVNESSSCISEFDKLLHERQKYYIFYGYFLALQNHFNKSICDTIYDIDSEYIFREWKRSSNSIITFITFLNEINKEKLFKWLQKSEITK